MPFSFPQAPARLRAAVFVAIAADIFAPPSALEAQAPQDCGFPDKLQVDSDKDSVTEPCEMFPSYGFDTLEQRRASGANEPEDRFGSTMVVGDFNGDGHGDVAVGAPGEGPFGAPAGVGAVFVFHGDLLGVADGGRILLQTQATRAGVAATQTAEDKFGSALAVGNFNGDAFMDLAVAAPGKSAGAGAVFVYYGSASGLMTANARWFRMGHLSSPENTSLNQPNNQFGFALAAGNFTGDAADELAVGVPGEASNAGAIAIFNGKVGTITSGAGLQDSGVRLRQSDTAVGVSNSAGDRFGAALAVGFFDAKTDSSKRADLIIGAPGEDAGKGVFSVLAGGTTLSATSFRRQSQCGGANEAGDQFAATLATGDINGDGVSDLVVGAPNEAVGSAAGAGAICVFFGTTSMDTVAGVQGWSGSMFHQEKGVSSGTAEAGDDFGRSLAVGDFDGDTFADVVVGAPGEAPGADPASGVLYRFAGQAGGLGTGEWIHPDTLRVGCKRDGGREVAGCTTGGDQFAAALATGDLDANGAADLLIGAPFEPVNRVFDADSGAVHLSLGSGARTAQLTHGPIVGTTTDSSTRVWVRVNGAHKTQIQYRLANQPEAAWLPTTEATASAANDFTVSQSFTGLMANANYDVRVRVDGKVRALSTFRTLAKYPTSVSFIAGADFNAARRPFSVMHDAANERADFAIYLGDMMYGDQGSPNANAVHEYNHKYKETFGDPALRRMMANTPTMMTWDDHEITNNYFNANGSCANDALCREALASYKLYQAPHNPAPSVTDGLHYSYRVGTDDASHDPLVDFFVLDTRSHRTQGGEPGVCQNVNISEQDPFPTLANTMLGETQRAQLLWWLRASPATFKVIVSSVPFNNKAQENPTDASDIWYGYACEREVIYHWLRMYKIEGVVLMSGDRHWPAVYRTEVDGYRMYELQATPSGTSARGKNANLGDDWSWTDDQVRPLYTKVTMNAGTDPSMRVEFCNDVTCIYDREIKRSEMGPPPPPPAPVTNWAAVGQMNVTSSMYLEGWAKDFNSAGPIAIHIYIDGIFRGATVANGYHPDVNGFGFRWFIPALGAGTHSVAAFAISVDGQGNFDGLNPPLTGAPASYFDRRVTEKPGI